MTPYELTNYQRKFFGLTPVAAGWDRQLLNEYIAVYFDENKLVKVLNYTWGYQEYDTEIITNDRKILLPKTARGKEQKLTVPRILKIKGCGVAFSGSFQGGNIHVYDNRRNLFFIKSFLEDGNINTYYDIDNWISNYILNLSPNYFDWLEDQLSQRRLRVNIKEGDIIAFRISNSEYGFARILLDVFAEIKKGGIVRPELYWVHPRSLIVAPYAYYADTLDINIDNLIKRKTLPSLCIFDLEVYRGEMPIVGNRNLSETDKQIQFPNSNSTCITIPYSKTDIEMFIAINGSENT